jgi:GT2 family glycosyltransferase
MTCFNRRQKTLLALGSIFNQDESVPRQITCFLVDDGSSDGTADAVCSAHPSVRLIRGDGSLYWNRGMRVAFAAAMREEFDYYLWVNDDTRFGPKALSTLLAAARKCEDEGQTAILVGSTCDPSATHWTYGGFRSRPRWKGLGLLPALPGKNELQPCDTMNGNCTLIPKAVAARLGNLDAGFRHGCGDFDYGFRARKAGFEIYVIPGYVGICAENSVAGTWRDRTAPLLIRWRNLVSPKGLPFMEWMLYTRRHCGLLWPLYTVSPYLKTIFGIGLPREGYMESRPKVF